MLTAVNHETIDCRSIFETHYTTLTHGTIEESSCSRITIFSRSNVHRASHPQRRSSTGSAWSMNLFLRSIPRGFFSIPFFVSRRRSEAKNGRRNRAKKGTRGTFDGKSRRNSNGARVFRITHGTYRFKYTGRACAVPRPTRPETALRFSISLSLVFLPNIVLPLEGKTQRLKKIAKI